MSGISWLNHVRISAVSKVLFLCLSYSRLLLKNFQNPLDIVIKESRSQIRSFTLQLQRLCCLMILLLKWNKSCMDITLTLKKQVSLFTYQKDRDKDLESEAPPHNQLRKLQGLCASSAVTALHHTRIAAMFFLLLFLLLLLSQSAPLCQNDVGSRELGNTFQGENTHAHPQHSPTFIQRESLSLRAGHRGNVLHETKPDSDISPN